MTELRKGDPRGSSAVTHPRNCNSRLRSTVRVSADWNFSRFLACVVRLEKKRGLVSAMVESLRASLFEELPDFGRHLGYDGKLRQMAPQTFASAGVPVGVESHSTGRVAEDKGKTSDPDADWGKHETSGVDAKTGKIWKKVSPSWFVYGRPR